MSTQTKAKNTNKDKASQSPQVKNEDAKKVNGTPKPELSETAVKEMLNPSAESRIKAIQNFQILADKYQKLQNKAQELEQFILSSDGTKEKILLQNQAGFTMEITNTQVVSKMVDVIKTELSQYIAKSESDVLNYTI